MPDDVRVSVAIEQKNAISDELVGTMNRYSSSTPRTQYSRTKVNVVQEHSSTARRSTARLTPVVLPNFCIIARIF